MGRFGNDRRGGFGGGSRGRDSRVGGRRECGRGFNGGRDGGRGGFGNRRRPEMHEVICDKCGKECQVPFKPTGDKPVLCSDCFRREGRSSGSSSRNSGSRNFENTIPSSGISQEQFKQINAKLDKILGILENIEFEEVEEDEEEESEKD